MSSTEKIERFYTPILPNDLWEIGIGTKYYRHSGDSIVSRIFPNTTESIDELKKLSQRGHLYFPVLNRADVESRNWYVESYNNDLVTFSKLILLQTRWVTIDFHTHEVNFYTKDISTDNPTVVFAGILLRVPDFDRVVRFIGYE